MIPWLDIAIAIPVAVLLVVVSGFFAGSEVALFSLRRVDREQLARSGRSGDKRVLRLLSQPRQLIAAALLGNEAVIGALFILALGVVAVVRPALALSWWRLGGVTLAVVLPLVVLLGEVMPKTLALKAPIAWARAAARPLAAFALLITPVRWLVLGIAGVLTRPFGSDKPRPARDLTEEEFRTLVDAGSAQGQLDARERRLIHRVFEFADKNVGQIMTPRERMFALSYDLPMQRLAKEIAARGFSRVPIYQKNIDNIRGILNAKDLVRLPAGQAPARTLGELLHEPLFVPRATPIKRLFLTFKQRKVHLGIVVNEYGKVLGLVTMDDVLGQLFGALRDEREHLQSGMFKAPRGPRTRTPVDVLQTGPVPLVPPAAEVPPASRVSDFIHEETPPEVTPPPTEVPLKIADVARRMQTAADDDDRAPRSRRPSTAPDDDGVVATPMTEADTGPSGPVKVRREST